MQKEQKYDKIKIGNWSFVRQDFVLVILLVGVSLLLAGLTAGIVHTVSAREKAVYVKYVTCITVEYGDSLWKLAEEYRSEGYDDIPSLIEEIKVCNHLYRDEIYVGEKLLIPYFVRIEKEFASP